MRCHLNYVNLYVNYSVSLSAKNQFRKELASHFQLSNQVTETCVSLFNKSANIQMDFIEQKCRAKLDMAEKAREKRIRKARNDANLLLNCQVQCTKLIMKLANQLDESSTTIGDVQAESRTFMEESESQLREVEAYDHMENFHRGMKTIVESLARQGNDTSTREDNGDLTTKLTGAMKMLQDLRSEVGSQESSVMDNVISVLEDVKVGCRRKEQQQTQLQTEVTRAFISDQSFKDFLNQKATLEKKLSEQRKLLAQLNTTRTNAEDKKKLEDGIRKSEQALRVNDGLLLERTNSFWQHRTNAIEAMSGQGDTNSDSITRTPRQPGRSNGNITETWRHRHPVVSTTRPPVRQNRRVPMHISVFRIDRR